MRCRRYPPKGPREAYLIRLTPAGVEALAALQLLTGMPQGELVERLLLEECLRPDGWAATMAADRAAGGVT